MAADDPDVALLARVGRGEAGAARELVASKLPRLLALGQRLLGNRAEAEEVAQEVFLRTWKVAPQWQAGQARLDTWLHRVAMNLCYDRLRKRQHEESGDDAADVLDPAVGPDESLAAAERGARLRAAIAALPARQREALVLQYYQELSNIEAAALMEVSVEALESLLSRARRAVRAQLASEGKE
ncbi:MAG TPA: RNA polymerase sigma factor [Burkholderiaceae bacterium]